MSASAPLRQEKSFPPARNRATTIEQLRPAPASASRFCLLYLKSRSGLPLRDGASVSERLCLLPASPSDERMHAIRHQYADQQIRLTGTEQLRQPRGHRGKHAKPDLIQIPVRRSRRIGEHEERQEQRSLQER